MGHVGRRCSYSGEASGLKKDFHVQQAILMIVRDLSGGQTSVDTLLHLQILYIQGSFASCLIVPYTRRYFFF